MNIIVPIHAEVLRVSPSTTQQSFDALYDFSLLGNHPISSQSGLIAAKNFSTRFSNLAPGLHVHWSIPRIYTRGVQDNVTGAIEFPTLPNRWLITRFYREMPGGQGQTAMWLMESDAYGHVTQQIPNAIPVLDAAQGMYGLGSTTMGHLIPLTGTAYPLWQEGKIATGINYLHDNFQALFAYGETFTAYYRNSGGSLGFYDSLADLNINLESASFSVSYTLIGWVNNPKQDVLYTALSTYDADKHPDFNAFVKTVFTQELAWELSDYSQITPANYQTIQGLLSGTVAGVAWDTKSTVNQTYPTTLPNSSQLTVAIGRSTAEAISAYVNGVEKGGSEQDPDEVVKNLEWLLNAFQYGQLQRLAGGQTGVGQLDESLHSRSFTAFSSGYIWTVRSPDSPSQGGQAPTDIEATLPLTLAKLLSQMNSYQQQLNSKWDEIESRQKKLFFDWSYHVDALYENVFKPQQYNNIQNDHTGAYLLDGMASLFPLYIQTGTYTECSQPQSFPMSFDPDTFSINAPSSQVPQLTTYQFNASANRIAEKAIGLLLGWQYALEAVIPLGLSNIQDLLQTAELLLGAYQPQQSDAANYQQQIVTLLTQAQTQAGALSSAFLQASQSPTNLDLLKQQIDQCAQALTAIWNSAQGSGTLAQWLPITNGGLHNSPYIGIIKDRTHFNYVQSWQGRDSFPGMWDLLNQMAGQGMYQPCVIDTQLAALYLALGYLWAHSGQGAATYAVAYYIEMAEQVVTDAIHAAQAASAAIQTAKTSYTGFMQTVGQALSDLTSTSANGTIQPILTAVNNGTPSDALNALQGLLSGPSTLTATSSIPTLQQAAQSLNWLAIIQSLETAWQTIASQLPLGHSAQILGSFIYAKVQDSYELKQAPADSFWQPNEPVIVLGEGKAQDQILRPVDRNGRAEQLPCRVEADLVQYSGISTYPPQIQNITTIIDPQITGLAQTMQSVLVEAYLLTPEFYKTTVASRDLASAAQLNYTTQEPLSDNVALLTASGNPQNPLPYQAGYLPYYIAYNFWQPATGTIDSNPTYNDIFLPLFIYWEAEYVYSQNYNGATETYPNSYLTTLFKDDEYEMDYQPVSTTSFQKNVSQPNFNTLNGVISLSSAATANLQDQLRVFCIQNLGGYDPKNGKPALSDDNYDEKLSLYEIYDAFNNWNVLSQSLSGFNSALQQRAQELQLPINIPATWKQNAPGGESSFWVTQFLHDQSANWIYTWAYEGLNFDAFAPGDQKAFFTPFRGGFLQITNLHLVDVFGRSIQVPSPNPTYVAESMQTPENQYPDSSHSVYLAPRLIQPSRVTFKWLSAESPDGMAQFTEWNPHPAASPICGWLMPNHLDDSLMVYDSTGQVIGSAGHQNTTVHWFPVPGEAVRNLDTIANPVLRQFLTDFVNPGSDFQNFQNFLQVVDLSQQFIITASMKQDTELGVLIGRPLVLAQAVLSLELQGLPDVSLDVNSTNPTFIPWNGSNTAFQLTSNGYLKYDFRNFNSANLQGIAIPALLGDPQIAKPGIDPIPYFDDGLVGYFVGDDKTFYTPLKLDQTYPGMQSTFGLTLDKLPIQLQPNSSPITITLLLDPRAVVRATTGILPVSTLSIPPDQYENGLSKLMVYFLTAPFLTYESADQPEFDIVVPAEKGYQWSWYQVGSADLPVKTPQHNTDASFPNDVVQHIVDGWLKLKKASS